MTLQSGWQVALDPSSGRAYFFNRKTSQTSWTAPPGFSATEVSDVKATSHQRNQSDTPVVDNRKSGELSGTTHKAIVHHVRRSTVSGIPMASQSNGTAKQCTMSKRDSILNAPSWSQPVGQLPCRKDSLKRVAKSIRTRRMTTSGKLRGNVTTDTCTGPITTAPSRAFPMGLLSKPSSKVYSHQTNANLDNGIRNVSSATTRTLKSSIGNSDSAGSVEVKSVVVKQQSNHVRSSYSMDVNNYVIRNSVPQPGASEPARFDEHPGDEPVGGIDKPGTSSTPTTVSNIVSLQCRRPPSPPPVFRKSSSGFTQSYRTEDVPTAGNNSSSHQQLCLSQNIKSNVQPATNENNLISNPVKVATFNESNISPSDTTLKDSVKSTEAPSNNVTASNFHQASSATSITAAACIEDSECTMISKPDRSSIDTINSEDFGTGLANPNHVAQNPPDRLSSSAICNPSSTLKNETVFDSISKEANSINEPSGGSSDSIITTNNNCSNIPGDTLNISFSSLVCDQGEASTPAEPKMDHPADTEKPEKEQSNTSPDEIKSHSINDPTVGTVPEAAQKLRFNITWDEAENETQTAENSKKKRSAFSHFASPFKLLTPRLHKRGGDETPGIKSYSKCETPTRSSTPSTPGTRLLQWARRKGKPQPNNIGLEGSQRGSFVKRRHSTTELDATQSQRTRNKGFVGQVKALLTPRPSRQVQEKQRDHIHTSVSKGFDSQTSRTTIKAPRVPESPAVRAMRFIDSKTRGVFRGAKSDTSTSSQDQKDSTWSFDTVIRSALQTRRRAISEVDANGNYDDDADEEVYASSDEEYS